MNNLHLFELINASPGLGRGQLWLSIILAQWFIALVPVGMTLAWIRGDHLSRRELLEMLLATAVALAAAQVIAHSWPQPRPFALHLGTQYIGHGADPGLPSDHVTVFWSLALAALSTRRFAVWCFPLLAAGLAVGWSRVFLGVHFPFDVLAALPVATLGALVARALRHPAMPAVVQVLLLYDRLANAARSWWTAARKA
ncbi:MAG: phosphatase PAP2 family protein [Methylibium sp.]|jgi:undecaprenyl-diphosphatase|uniref:phosphatase PAP2 family protein n=1 Tax=Methylibium sp. TaxID=2067992 RepID=UPI00275B143C|nr:phosphatase PAP2 family protein [Methylibium sp.]